MTDIPADLVPLPTMPYEERPVGLPLDMEECRTALWRCRGNISLAARLIKVSSSRLRNYVAKSPRLTDEVREAQQQLVDVAEDIAYEALTDGDDPGRRDQMARFVMSNLGRDRGYGTGKAGVTINNPKGPVVIQWADGQSLSGPQNDNNMIDVSPVAAE